MRYQHRRLQQSHGGVPVNSYKVSAVWCRFLLTEGQHPPPPLCFLRSLQTSFGTGAKHLFRPESQRPLECIIPRVALLCTGCSRVQLAGSCTASAAGVSGTHETAGADSRGCATPASTHTHRKKQKIKPTNTQHSHTQSWMQTHSCINDQNPQRDSDLRGRLNRKDFFWNGTFLKPHSKKKDPFTWSRSPKKCAFFAFTWRRW